MVRLKGGCPSLFSRAASEIAALASAGVPFELIPGVTSASAAAANASIPLTRGTDFAAVIVVSAHKAEAVAWAAYGPAAASTLVVLMGGRAIREVVAGCMGAGWPECTRVCSAAACTSVLLLPLVPWCAVLCCSVLFCAVRTAYDCASLARAMHCIVGLGSSMVVGLYHV